MAITGIGDSAGKFSIYPAEERKNTKKDVENEINRLEKQRELYKEQRENSGSGALDAKIDDLEKKIGNLQQRLKKMRSTASEPDDGKCETCENRKYQDGSNDPGVSFKTASKVSGNAEAAVRGHEYEHVNRNQAKAAREGKEIVYQTVTLSRAICPECGKSYVSGGETVTVTQDKPESRFDVGLDKGEGEKGDLFDAVA
ncbi:MAG: hypothetical protein HDT44_03995 [Ruminococcaceae bacterium]|nr:hypothetical protein [Oscillospiraceae bacterium]